MDSEKETGQKGFRFNVLSKFVEETGPVTEPVLGTFQFGKQNIENDATVDLMNKNNKRNNNVNKDTEGDKDRMGPLGNRIIKGKGFKINKPKMQKQSANGLMG